MPILISKDGEEIVVDDNEASTLLRRPDGQWRLRTSGDVAARVGEEVREERYGGVAGTVGAGIAGVARSLTLGGSDALLSAAGAGDTLRALREQHPIISTAGEVVGDVAAAGLTGGGSLVAKAPAAAAARLGSRIARVEEGASTLAKIGRSALGYGTEGAIVGAGTGVSELSLSSQPLTAERFASTLSSGALYGSAFGAGSGAGARIMEKGLGSAKTALDEYRAGREARAGVSEDLATLDRKGLDDAYRVELEAVEAGRAPQRQQLAGDIAAHRETSKTEQVWLATQGAKERELREIGKISLEADKALDRTLRNPKALAEDPKGALRALQQQEHALERLDTVRRNAGDAPLIPKYAELGNEPIVSTIKARDVRDYGYQQLKGATDDPAGVARGQRAIAEGQREPIKVAISPKGTLNVSDGRNRLAAAVEADADIIVQWERGTKALDSAKKAYRETLEVIGGEGLGGLSKTARDAIDKVPAVLERNRGLQDRIRALTAAPDSERLRAIVSAKEVLAAGRGEKTIAEQMLAGSVFSMATGGVAAATSDTPLAGVGAMVAPFVGAKASKLISEKVFGGFSRATSEATARSAKAVAALFDRAQKVTGLPPLSTHILSRVRFAERIGDEDRDQKQARPSSADLARLFKARSAELRSQVVYTADGQTKMAPDARAALGARLAPLRAVDPIGADRLETIAARRVEFLASKLPKRPEIGGMPLALADRWQPSDLQIRKWARYVAAVEDPVGVFERLGSGAVTLEDTEAIKAVYPEMHADFTRQVIERMATLRTSLPYESRLALSRFTGAAVDASMEPRIVAVLQQTFTKEAGTEGGTRAPQPQPQFGSVSREPGTPAQQRQERRGA